MQRQSLLLILISLFLTAPVYSRTKQTAEEAQQQDKIINKEALELRRQGYGNYPVVRCPGIKTEYLELVNTLSEIQENIKADACPEAEKKKVEEEIASVQDLLKGKQRQEFTRIVEKGITTNGEVSQKEAETVRGYIESVVTTTAVVTGLTRNSACFEDSKDITLATLSSIVSEASSALGAITGPMGTKITLGGQLAAGVIDSVAKIMITQETYCKGLGSLGIGTCKYTPEAEQAYVSTLCSYYRLKFDIDEHTNPQERIRELDDLERASDTQLALLRRDCAECRRIYRKFNASVDAADPFESLTSQAPVTFIWESAPLTSAEEAAPSIETSSKPLYDYSYDELVGIFAREIRQASSRTESSDVALSQAPYETIRALRTRAWAIYERERIEQISEDDPDVGLNQVSIEQNKIENFLFADEAPKYLKYAAKRAKDSAEELMVMAYSNYLKLQRSNGGAQLARDEFRDYTPLQLSPSPSLDYARNVNAIVDVIHDIFRAQVTLPEKLVETLGKARQRTLERRMKNRVRSLQSSLQAKLRETKRNYAVFRDYCRMFEYGNLNFEGPVGDACIKGHDQTLSGLKRLFSKLEATALGAVVNGTKNGELPRSSVLGDVNQEDLEYSRNWVASLTAATDEKNENIRNFGIGVLESENDFKRPSAAPVIELYNRYPNSGIR